MRHVSRRIHGHCTKAELCDGIVRCQWRGGEGGIGGRRRAGLDVTQRAWAGPEMLSLEASTTQVSVWKLYLLLPPFGVFLCATEHQQVSNGTTGQKYAVRSPACVQDLKPQQYAS